MSHNETQDARVKRLEGSFFYSTLQIRQGARTAQSLFKLDKATPRVHRERQMGRTLSHMGVFSNLPCGLQFKYMVDLR